jgi:hypothetical protein
MEVEPMPRIPIVPARGPPPSDRSWLPLCNENGEFFQSDTTFQGVDDWIREREITLPCGYREREGFEVDRYREENPPLGSHHRGTTWNPVLKGLNADDPDFFNSFRIMSLKSATDR